MTSSNKPVQVNPGLNLRTEFAFVANDQTLACVLKDIAANSVNITGFFITTTRGSNNFVRLVAGITESESSRDLRVVRETLQSLHVDFKEEKIIAISTIPSGVPGGLSGLFGSLWCRVEVHSIYVGEEDIIFLNVSNIKKALEILSHENVRPCPNKCSDTRNNRF